MVQRQLQLLSVLWRVNVSDGDEYIRSIGVDLEVCCIDDDDDDVNETQSCVPNFNCEIDMC